MPARWRISVPVLDCDCCFLCCSLVMAASFCSVVCELLLSLFACCRAFRSTSWLKEEEKVDPEMMAHLVARRVHFEQHTVRWTQLQQPSLIVIGHTILRTVDFGLSVSSLFTWLLLSARSYAQPVAENSPETGTVTILTAIIPRLDAPMRRR
jgi:hypothetical protein